uniref:Putative sodium/potassium-transporting atpase subunit beta-2 n=2 Tax=Culex tarsalis TaxID=7177 RepID=A0A1Q3FKF7_CULTA
MSKEKKMSRVITTYEFPSRPEKRSFAQFVFDKDTGYICGRSTKNWGQLMLFYMSFYIVLAALFTICMQTTLATMNHQYPKWQLDASLIGTNPGLAYRPMPDDPDISGTVIEYRAANKSDVKQWVNRLDAFLAPYRDHQLPGEGQNQIPCDFDTKLNPGQVCEVDVAQFTPCTSEQGYSYNKSAPCIFVKLNKIYGWLPEFYDDVDDLPEDMPTDLVDHIKSLKPKERQQVWVSCKGLSESDDMGPVEYSNNRGFPSYYYPYTNQQGYLSPLVAVHFARPAVKTAINIECRAWAKNVMYRGGSRDRRGSIHFVLLIE